MSKLEEAVARHYTHGHLQDAIMAGLAAIGRAPAEVRAEDLAAVDEFHMGGHEATRAVVAHLAPEPGSRHLDIGCGIGGAARYIARSFGCIVTGIDLTPEYVQVGQALTRMVRLADKLTFRVGSGTDLPFDDASFDSASLLHVGQNIEAKDRLAQEVARVLRPGGKFVVYDVMQVGEGDLVFPVPWAMTPATSRCETPETYRQVLEAAGFSVGDPQSYREMAIEFFQRMRARIAESGPPPLGLHIPMGQDAPIKVANLLANLEAGRVAPVELMCRRAP
jgi:ubiquinone/menaquinone biosynthesis C-methylase UbiE